MLFDQLQSDLKKAQLEKNEAETSTLRLLLSEIKYVQINQGRDLSDEDIVSVVQKEIKKRKEAAVGFRLGGREEAAEKEEGEAKLLEKYLPAQLSDEELSNIVDQVITEVGATNISDMGKVIGMVMGKIKGQADGARVSGLVKERLL